MGFLKEPISFLFGLFLVIYPYIPTMLQIISHTLLCLTDKW